MTRAITESDAEPNAIWQALQREASMAAEQLAIGVTALGKANYAQKAYYYQAFFALGIGFERAAKLALIVDYALDNGGTLPPNENVCRYRHNIKELLKLVDEIAERRGLSREKNKLPVSIVHDGIIEILSDFANNITRYYNLDLVTNNLHKEKQYDPINAWFHQVTLPILDTHYKLHHKKRHKQNAYLINQWIEPYTSIYYHDETGEVLNSVYDASMQTAITKFANSYTRMYVMQIVRFMGGTLSELGDIAQRKQLSNIPYLSEIFAIYNNSDEYFKNRKTWSIYGL